MAFEGLSDKLGKVFSKLKNHGKLNEKDVKEAMREVKMALLEADVSFPVVKDFVAKVSERAVGSEVMNSLTPAQQVIDIVHDELIKLMGTDTARIDFPSKPPCVIMMCGLQGAGKTTHTAKLAKYLKKQELKKEELKRLKNTVISPDDEVNKILVSRETSEITTGVRLIELMKRPQLGYDALKSIDKTRPELDPNIFEQVEIEIKYEGYIQKQLKQVEQMKKLEVKQLPNDFDYNEIEGLRLEAREKLNKIKPLNIGQASRISGVSPADISVLLIWLAQNNRRQ